MTEKSVLVFSLFNYGIGFLIKCLVFSVLAWFMRPSQDETRLGRAMFHHYVSLATQALPLATVYLYYALFIHEPQWVDWVTPNMRIVLYIVGTILVDLASWFGFALLVTYWNAPLVEGDPKRRSQPRKRLAT